jgi:hypothetical protein
MGHPPSAFCASDGFSFLSYSSPSRGTGGSDSAFPPASSDRSFD